MDVGQLTQFMIGSALSLVSKDKRTSPDAIKKATQNIYDKAIEAKKGVNLRAAIEQTLPVIYVVDVKNILYSVLTGLNRSLEKNKISDYVYSITSSIGETFFSGEANFDFVVEQQLQLFENDLLQGNKFASYTNKIMTALDKTFTNVIRERELIVRVGKALRVLNNLQPQIAVGIASNNSEIVNKTNAQIEAVIRETSASLRDYYRSKFPAKLSSKSASEYIQNYNSDYQLVIFVDSYTRAVDLVNQTVTKELREIFEANYNFVPTVDFTAGSFSAAGHTGIITKEGGIAKVVGINTPITQRILLAATLEGPKASGINFDNLILNTDHVKTSVQVNKTASLAAKTLLSMQFSVLISMETEYNSVVLGGSGGQEVREIDAVVQKFFAKTRKDLFESWKASILSAKGLRYLVSFLKFSPTIIQSLQEDLIHLIRTGKDKQSNASTSFKTNNLLGNKSVIKPNVSSSTKKAKVGRSKSITKSKRAVQLDNTVLELQTLLDANLVEKVKQNMGTGTSKNVLNLRSGRFAESVKVRNISKSRQGMISVFYTYMKNPYATFSAGGRQELPRSRDPKLLISRSIRELARANIANRLRAVLI